MPLVIVLVAAGIKDLIEDLSRWKQDRAANNAIVKVLRKGSLIDCLAKDLAPGDIVYYEKGGKFDFDAIILSTSFEDGSCFVDTAELDG